MALTDTEKPVDEQVVDIQIDGIKKQRFRINGDPKSIIELNISDLSISDRLEKGYKKLQDEMSNIASISEDDDKLSEKMAQANKVMCEWIDYIFDSPVSAVLCKSGTMYDPYNGMFRYEHIIDSLTKLYTDNINDEYKKLKARVQKYTEKYVGKKSGRSKR